MHGVDFENPWLLGVDRARLRVPAWAAALGSVVFAVALLLFFRSIGPRLAASVAGMLKGLPDGWGEAVAADALQLLVFAPFLGIAGVGMMIEGRRIRGHSGRSLPWMFGGLLIGAVGFCASVAIAALAGAVGPGSGAALAPIALSALLGLVIVGFQALAEEVFFRAWLQPLLGVQWGPWVGLIITSGLFAGLHIIAGADGVLAIVNLFLGGLLFGLLAFRSGGLAAPAAAHFAWNWTETGGLGLDPTPTGGLVSLQLHGARLWSGGIDTMNGSLATTIVLTGLVLILVLVGALRPDGRGRAEA